MEFIFAFISEIPTYYFYIGGVVLLVLLYQRYDENNRYNQKSGPAPEPVKPMTSSAPASPEKTSPASTAKTQIVLNQQMITFLKSYDPSKDSWTNWAIKKMFPAEIVEDLQAAVAKGELKEGMKIKIEDGKWEELMKQ